MADIKIAKTLKDDKDPKAGHKLEPVGGRLTMVKAGEVVTFRADADVVDLTIQFVDRSPFGAGKEVVPYNTPVSVVVAVDADRNQNLYTYSCVASGLKSEGGGEMEVAN